MHASGTKAALLSVFSMVLATMALVVAPPALAAPPANDDFAAAQVLSGVGVYTGTNLEATTEPGEPVRHVSDIPPPDNDYAATASVWYRWTSPDSDTQPMMQVSTRGSAFDTVLAVYTGADLTHLTEVDGNDEFGAASGPSRVQFAPTRNTTYYIAVDSCCDGTVFSDGAIRLRLSETTGDGSIQGFVTDGSHGIEGICVVALDSSGEQVSSQEVRTDAAGEYLLASVEAGPDRHLKFSNCGSSNFAGQFNGGAQTLGTAPDIVVLNGQDLTDVDTVLVPGATITGTVTADDGGTPLSDICVRATMVGDPDDGFTRSASTDTDGTYTIDGLDGGDYQVEFAGTCASNQDFGVEQYPTPVHVVEGDTVAGIDAGLGAAPGTITGTVHSWETGPGIANICVRASNSSFTSSTVDTTSSGSYTISNVPAGTGYVVRFSDCHAGSNPYTTQWYNRALTQAAATTIAVTSGHTTSGIDASMFRAATLAGHATDSSGAPRDGVCVGVYQSGGSLAFSTTTAADGGWSVTTPPGTYQVFFSKCAAGPAFQDLWWHSRTTQGSAEDVFVDQAQHVGDIDQLLPGDGMISGRVVNPDNQPVKDICVSAYADGSPIAVAEDFTDAYGYYDLGVDAGTYDVQYLDCTYRYQEQWFDDEADQASADPVVVPASTTVRANATLARWGTISGTIRDEAGDPVAGICVSTYDSSGTQLDNEIEDGADGTYTVGGMATGNYRILFTDCTGTRYNDAFYDNRLTLDTADPVHVTLGNDTGGKDVVLHGDAPTNVVPPAISGDARRGVTLTADPGTWDHAPSVYSYQWFRCDASGVTCSPVGDDAASYQLTRDDLGDRIRVDVRATNAAGDATAPSDLTDVVADGPPPNDDIGNREVLSGSLPIHVTGDNINATRQPGEPAHDGYTKGASVWYEWTAPSGAGAVDRAVIDTSASSYLATTSVYTGDPSSFSDLQLVVEDDYTDGFTGTVDFAPVPGTTYYIAVDGYFDGRDRTTDTGNIDLTLSSGTGLSGTVTDTNGDPIRGICVTAYNDDGGNQRTTGADGTFYMSVPPGYYKVEYEDCPTEYATQWYDGADVEEGATPVQVVADTVTTGIDAQLDRVTDFGSISGTVTNDDGDPIPNICVSVTNADGSWGGNAWTAADGTYQVRGLGDPAGPVDYTVDFSDCSGFYGPESWDNQIDSADADPVTVTWDEPVTGIDAVLQSDPPVNISLPVARGRAAVGVTLRATNGTWAHDPTVFGFQWYRCEADGTGCAAVDAATDRDYTPTVDDIGYRFRVKVAARNSMDTTNAQSALTDVVVAASAPPNDDIADRQALSGSLPITTTGDNIDATREPGEPDHLGLTEGASVWYEWTASSDDMVTIDLTGSDFDTTLSVYDGTPSPFSGLHLVAENDQAYDQLPASMVTFTPVPGTTYYIAVDGYVDPSTHEISEGSIDLRLDKATGIAGTVTEQGSGVPVDQVCVTATDTPEEVPSGPSVQTGIDGTYYLELPPGTWYVDYYDCTGQYEEQWYDGVTAFADADPVTVTAQQVTTGVDASMAELVPYGSISGTVTNEDGDPLPDICVIAADLVGGSGGYTTTDANGDYRIRGLGDPDHPTDAVDYVVGFSDCSGTYGGEFYDNKLDPSSADPVPVELDQDVTGIDATLQNEAPVNTVLPQVVGAATIGANLSVTNGSWQHEPSDFAFEWMRCTATGGGCAPIPSATGRTYVTTADDGGHKIRVQVTATNSVGRTTVLSLSNGSVTGVPASVGPPAVSGPSTIGATLSVSAGTWSGTPTSFSYQWMRCDTNGANCTSIVGEQGTTYITTASDAGRKIRVNVTATNTVGSATVLSLSNGSVTGAPAVTELPVLSGPATVGVTLSVTTGGWTGSPSSFAYQWMRCDTAGANCVAISGAQTSGYVTTSNDAGHKVRARVTATNSAGSTAALSYSNGVIATPSPPGSPQVAELPFVTGPAEIGATLSVEVGAWNGSPTSFAYQWMRCDGAGANCTAIGGAQNSSYVTNSGDAGHKIRVEVTATNSAGSSTALSYSNGRAIGVPVSLSLPVLTGTPQVGATLTVTAGTWSGAPTNFSYQWVRCDVTGASCDPIVAAMATSYVLVEADRGHKIRVQVAASNAVGTETALSYSNGVTG